jgi:hypothetical protein
MQEDQIEETQDEALEEPTKAEEAQDEASGD